MKWRGSLPELRAPTCPHGGHGARLAHRLPCAGDSEDSTEELLDEAERFLRSSIDCLSVGRAPDGETRKITVHNYMNSGQMQGFSIKGHTSTSQHVLTLTVFKKGYASQEP